MLYCYLSDGALTPLISKPLFNGNELFGSYQSSGAASTRSGVAQMDERVLSVFNDDTTAEAQTGLNRKYHCVVRDPRSLRLSGLFTGDASYVSNTSAENAVGSMELHFDRYWAEKEATSDVGNAIYDLDGSANLEAFKKLFNVIETILLTHVFDAFDPSNTFWRYKNAEELDIILRSNLTLYGAGSSDPANPAVGYVAESLSIPALTDTDKRATVQNKGTTNIIKTDIGTNQLSKNQPIYFPNYIQFQFRFGPLAAPTWFCIYLNPDYLLSNYSRCRITNIISPIDPTNILNPVYSNTYAVLRGSSAYVANVMTGEITKTNVDPFLTTNCTGAVAYATRYYSTDTDHYDYTFTCVYKGRKPTAGEMRDAVREMLEAASSREAVKDKFRDLYITTSFVIVPQYDTRIVADVASGIQFCKNIIGTAQFLKNYNGKDTATAFAQVPSTVIETSSNLNVAGYLMHLLVYSLTYDAETQRPVTLDSIDVFKSYQPINTTDLYWGALSDRARELNSVLSKIIGAQINNTAIPSEITYYTEPKEVFSGQGNRTYITFSVGGYNFSLMTRESYMRGQ